MSINSKHPRIARVLEAAGFSQNKKGEWVINIYHIYSGEFVEYIALDEVSHDGLCILVYENTDEIDWSMGMHLTEFLFRLEAEGVM